MAATGYIVEQGVSRQPYGGHAITQALNNTFTQKRYRFFTDVEFQIVRLAMEKVRLARRKMFYLSGVCLSPRQGVLCFHLGCCGINNVCPSVRPCVCVSVCPTFIGGILYAALLPFRVGRLTRDLGQMTANTSQMCLLGVT